MKYSELIGMSVLGKLNHLSMNYDNSYQIIAEYLLTNDKELNRLTISDIASNCFVSKSTVERFCKILGYNKYSEFKYDLLHQKTNNFSSKEVYDVDVYFSELHKALDDTLACIDVDQLQNVACKIVNSNSIFIVGLGSSYLIALDLSYKLQRMGLNCIATNDQNIMRINSQLLGAKDVCIGISYSCSTQVVKKVLSNASKNGSTTICMTHLQNKYLLDYVDHYLVVSAVDKMIRNNSSSSRIALLALVDALHTEILQTDKAEQLLKNISNSSIYDL